MQAISAKPYSVGQELKVRTHWSAMSTVRSSVVIRASKEQETVRGDVELLLLVLRSRGFRASTLFQSGELAIINMLSYTTQYQQSPRHNIICDIVTRRPLPDVGSSEVWQDPLPCCPVRARLTLLLAKLLRCEMCLDISTRFMRTFEIKNGGLRDFVVLQHECSEVPLPSCRYPRWRNVLRTSICDIILGIPIDISVEARRQARELHTATHKYIM